MATDVTHPDALAAAADALEQLARVLREIPAASAPAAAVPREETWRERLWTVPPETRIGRTELLEALGRPRSWLYRCTSAGSRHPRIPHRKLDGELVFVVGEVRAWLLQREEVVQPGRSGPLVVTRSRAGSGR